MDETAHVLRVLVFEGEAEPLKSIFCILLTHSIMEVAFIIQTTNR